MSNDLCLNCGKLPIEFNNEIMGLYHRDETSGELKHWDTCANCYRVFMDNGIQFRDYQTKIYFKKYKKYGCKPKKPICLWYSVRPPHDMDEKQFIKRIEKFINSKSIEKAEYTFEWKYENKKRYGIHCHMLLWGALRTLNQHILRQKERYFKLNLDKQKYWLYDLELLKEKQDYVKGDTWDEDKDKEKFLDKDSRKILGIPNTLYKM